MARRIGVWLDLHGDPYIREGGRIVAASKVMNHEFETLGRNTDHVSEQLALFDLPARRVTASVRSLGTESKRAAAEVKGLDEQVKAARANVGRLATEFGRTGDIQVQRDLNLARRAVTQLERTRRDILAISAGSTAERAAALAAAGVADTVRHGILAGIKDINLGPIRPILIGGLVGLVAVAAPFLGAAISGAVVGAVGVGGIIGGIVAAAHDPRVKAAFGDFTQSVKTDFFAAGEPFVGPVQDALHILAKGFHDLDLENLFSKAAPSVAVLAQGVTDLFKNAMPGLNAVMDRSGPIVQTLADGLGEVGTGFGDFLTEVSSSPGTLDGLKDAFTFIADAERGIGEGLKALSDTYHWLKQIKDIGPIDLGDMSSIPPVWLAQKIGEGSNALEARQNALQRPGDVQRAQQVPGARAYVESFGEYKGPTSPALKGITAETSEVANSAKTKRDAAKANHELALAEYNLSHAIGDTNGKAQQQRDAMEAMATSLSKATRQANDMWGAQIDAAQAVHDATVALKENGKGWDLNTEKGIQNQKVIHDAIDAVLTQRDAEIANSDGTTAAVNKIKAKYQEQIDKLKGVAVQMGATKTEADKLATPKTLTFTTNEIAAENALDRIAQHARNVPSYIHTTVGVSWMAAKAEGGFVPPGQATLVGERGSEIITPLVPSWVTPHDQVAAYQGAVRGGDGASSGNTLIVNVNVAPGANREVGAYVVRAIRSYEEANGRRWRTP
jgi:hypothetical protein